MTFSLEDPDRPPTKAELAEARGPRRDVRAMLEHARELLEPELDSYLKAVMADAIAGGRHSDTARRIVAELMLGLGGGSRDVTNVFIGRLGVPEEEARTAVEQVDLASRMDPVQIAMVAARYLRTFVDSHPERRVEVHAAIFGDSPAQLTGG